jgi:membrane-associated phospholipid phosphatase
LLTQSQVLAVSPISTRNKVIFFTLISLLGTVLYFATLHSTRFSPTVIPATPIDNLIPFTPLFIFAYVSFFVFVPLPLVFIRTLAEFVPAALGFLLIVVISNAVFFLWPTVIPSGAPYHPLLHGIFLVDRDRNACPSLHASLALYSCLCINKHLSSKFSLFVLWFWALTIIASPLLIKRHMFIDIAAGASLAAITYLGQSALKPINSAQS